MKFKANIEVVFVYDFEADDKEQAEEMLDDAAYNVSQLDFLGHVELKEWGLVDVAEDDFPVTSPK